MPIQSAIAALFSVMLAITVSTASGGPASSNADASPLTVDQVLSLIRNETDRNEVLAECKRRRVGFVCDASTLRDLKSAGAHASLLNAITKYSVPIQGNAERATQSLAAGDFDSAINISSEILNRSPRYLDMLWIRARAQIEVGRLDEAINDLVRLRSYDLRQPSTASGNQPVSVDWDEQSITTLLLESRLRAGQFRKVIADTTRLLTEGGTNSSTLWQIRGQARAINGDHESAAVDFTQALLAGPRNSDVYAQYAFLLATTTHQRLQNCRAALELATAASFVANNDVHRAEAHRAMAAAYSCLKDFAAAVREQQRALELAPARRSSDYSAELLSYQSERSLTTYNSEMSSSRDSVAYRLLTQMVRVGPPDTTSNLWKNVSNHSGGEFRISTLEVTTADWAQVFGQPITTNPKHAVDRVSWDDCQLFLKKLNTLSPKPVFRLPTESEWILAAGENTPHHSAKSFSAAELNEIAWYRANSGARLHPVGQLKANQYGLRDMFGNAAEWCSDAVRTSDGIVYSDFRVHRGGSFASSEKFANATQQSFSAKVDRRHGLGLRLAADDHADFAALVANADPLAVQGFDRVIQLARLKNDAAMARAEKQQIQKNLDQLLTIRESISAATSHRQEDAR